MAQRSNNNRGNRGNDRSMMSHWGETAKEKPFTTAAAAAGAVAAGVFLWSRRNQISDQISRLSDQITDWTDDMRSGGSPGSSREFATTEGIAESSTTRSNRGTAGSRSSATRSTGSANRSTRGPTPTSGRTVGSERASVETFNS